MLISILALYAASLLAITFYRRFEKVVAPVLSVILIGLIIGYATTLSSVVHGEWLSETYSWVDSLNIRLAFYLDGLSLFFALLITIIGLLVLVYSFRYMENYEKKGSFFAYLLLFMGSMLGLVLSSNLIGLFIFWELTSLSSFLLIGFNNQNKDSRRAARQALLITSGGGLALMSGFILLEIITQSGFDLLAMINQSPGPGQNLLLPAAIILIVIGAMTKSAQFPFHFWLPNAMAAPTPVSAYLHSATMVKAGIYLLFRLNPLFQDVVLWSYMLGIIGAITMMWGAFRALQEEDLKKILAYTTISALGIFFMMTGFGGERAMNAVLIYVLAHALYKGGLFLIAGNVEHQTGTRNIEHLSDLVKKMPYTALAVILSCASMAGIIPFIGFSGKEAMYATLYHSENPLALLYLILLILAGVAFTTVTLEIVQEAFLEKGQLKNKKVLEANILMVFAPVLLSVAGLITGVLPSEVTEPLLQWASANSLNAAPSMDLKLWHGFNMVFVLSLLTLLAGAGLFFVRKSFRRFSQVYWMDADFFYDKFIRGTNRFATAVTKVIQNGYLRNYLTMVILTFSALMIAYWSNSRMLSELSVEKVFSGIQIYEAVIITLVTVAVIVLFRTKSRLIVTATFGIIGYGIALAYTLFSAPDVAITQFLAETLTLILLILILHRLPSYTLGKNIAHKKYLPVALLFGLIMTVTSFFLLERETNADLKSYFLENSLSEGKGANAVNVILTDFRALDTLGEITVLTITMIGIVALLNEEMRTLILSTILRILTPLFIGFAVYMFFRGHDNPGGGFIAGLIASIPLMIHAMVFGCNSTREKFRINPRLVAGIGLLLALVSGMFALTINQPYLSSIWTDQELILIGKAGTPILFDMGVFFVVFGVVLQITFVLTEE